MSTLQEVYAAIADGPLSAAGLLAYDHVPGESEWPAAYMLPPHVEFQGLNHGWLECDIRVIILVSAALDKKQRDLLAYQDAVGDQSIAAHVLADPSLGLPDLDLTVTRTRPMNLTEQADYRAFGAVIELTARIG
jgi:hypothetical protein